MIKKLTAKIFNRKFKNAGSFPIPKSVWQNPLYFIAFGFGSGTLPIAPGTFGTLFAISFYLLLQPLSNINYLIVTTGIIIASIFICDKVSKELKIHDHPGMCLDEFSGYFVTMFAAPHGIFWIVSGFLLFRFFDIWKPWPISFLDENINGGFGMVIDDLLAGIFGFFILQIIARI